MASDDGTPPFNMTDYDRKAWAEIQAWKDRQLRARVRRRVPAAVRERAAVAGAVVRRATHAIPGANQFEKYFAKGLEALLLQGFELSISSVRTEAILASYRRAGFDVQEVQDIRNLELADIDRVKPNLSLSYASAGAIEGAGAGLAITGSELLTSTGAGPAMVVSAIAGDAALTLLAGLRLVAHTAEYYGFDTSFSDEHGIAWLLGMLSVGAIPGTANKAAAYRELSKVAQQLTNRSWKFFEKLGYKGQIPKSPVTKFISEVLVRLGFKVTARKVEKLLPVVGVGLGAGQNAVMLRRIAVSADRLCRERWLAERYGIAPDVPEVPEDGEAVPISELMEEMETEIAEEMKDREARHEEGDRTADD